MKQTLLDDYAKTLEQLQQKQQYRNLPQFVHQGQYVVKKETLLFNLSSNDYMGVANTGWLQQQFFCSETYQSVRQYPLGSSSSRLLTGNFAIFEQLEGRLAGLFGRSALLFGGGYAMNVGVLSALCDDHTVVLADKLIHASMIDGILLSKARFKRFAHQDLGGLKQLIERYENDNGCRRIIVVTESIFSMDGDVSDLRALVALKNASTKVMLYVDEAHAVGVRGAGGLGIAKEQGVLDDIDVFVATFGKAYGSMGGFVICHSLIRDYLINTARSLIFSTALPPMVVAWTDFVCQYLVGCDENRQYLYHQSQKLIAHIKQLGFYCPADSHIVPMVLGDNALALTFASKLEQMGFYALPIRPPTTPKARLRFCLNSLVDDEVLAQLCWTLQRLSLTVKMESG